MKNKVPASRKSLEALINQQIKKYPNQRVRLEKELVKLKIKK